MDAQLRVPERKYSSLLSEWMLRFCVKGAYDGAVEDLKALLGLSVPKRSMEVLAGEVSESVEAFEEQVAPPGKGGKILVVGVDGKGVPMRRETSKPAPKRLKKGEKQTKKKMAMVGTVYSLEEALEESSPSTRRSSRRFLARSRCSSGSESERFSAGWRVFPRGLFLQMGRRRCGS